MKFFALATLAQTVWSAALAPRQASIGTGPYPAMLTTALKYTTDDALPGHTIYQPQDLGAVQGKMPVLVWGNGACSANGLSHQNFNIELASWGILVIASGAPNGQGGTSPQTMKDSIDFITKAAGTGNYANVDASKIAAAGMSCGGLEAYANAQDPRLKALGIFNSGEKSPAETQNVVPPIKKPIFYFLGGTPDIAYENGMRDYAAVSEGVPTMALNLPVGHGGTYGDVNGGKFGKAAQNWARWLLKGDLNGTKEYLTEGAKADGWTIVSKSLENLQPVS